MRFVEFTGLRSAIYDLHSPTRLEDFPVFINPRMVTHIADYRIKDENCGTTIFVCGEQRIDVKEDIATVTKMLLQIT